MPSLFETIIILFVLGGIAFVVFRGGQANPEGTGQIRKMVSGIDGRLRHVEAAIKDMATTADIETVKAEMKGDRDLNQRTYESVRRIENFLIEKGLGGR